MTVAQLRQLARKLALTNYSGLKKAELIDLIASSATAEQLGEDS